MEVPVCANAFEPSDKTPTNNRVPIFFIHASNCIGKGCKYKHGGEFLARRSLSSPIIAGLLAKDNPSRDQSASLFRQYLLASNSRLAITPESLGGCACPLWSFASIRTAARNFRSTPDNRHVDEQWISSLWARRRHRASDLRANS
jgi:hypothetical protein